MAEGPLFRRAGGIFASIHEDAIGAMPDLSGLRLSEHPPERIEIARSTWSERVQSEFRSIQIMARFLSEVVGAGDPVDVYAGALELVRDEIRHTALCLAVCEALGVSPHLPDPVRLVDPEPFLSAPPAERALATAVTMLLVNETISLGYIEDLRARATGPIRAVLDATAEDEADHGRFGTSYVRASLARFPIATLSSWRHLARTTLAPHRDQAERILGNLTASRRALDAWPEPELAVLGLFSPQRQALVFFETLERVLLPRLAELNLSPEHAQK